MLVAHQGGWDEVLMVLVPIGLFGLLLWLANRRAEAKVAEDAKETAAEPDDAQPR